MRLICRLTTRFAWLGVCIATLAAGACNDDGPQLGTAARPFTVAFVPSRDIEQLERTGRTVADQLAGETGLVVDPLVPKSYADLVASLGDGRAQMAFMNTTSYLLAREQHDVTARLVVIRGSGEERYKGMIVARYDSGIYSLYDLQDRAIAFTDAQSAAGHLMPSSLLRSLGVAPGQTIWARTHDRAIQLVYDGEVDAGAAYFNPKGAEGKPRDARSSLVARHPDVFDVVRIVGYTRDIPNEPVVFHPTVPDEMQQRIIAALLAYVDTDEGRLVLGGINGIAGLRPVTDSAYDALREATALMQAATEQSPAAARPK